MRRSSSQLDLTKGSLSSAGTSSHSSKLSKLSSESIQNKMKDVVFQKAKKRAVLFKKKAVIHSHASLDGKRYSKSDDPNANDRQERQIPDLHSLIENKVKKFVGDQFIYLTYTVPNNSEFFTPYSLAETDFKTIPSKSQYYTMSRHGVTFWSQTENYFTELNQWQREFQMYITVVTIKLFAKFRMWKGFKGWEKSVKWKKYEQAYMYLSENLFYAIPHLASAALQLRSDFFDMQNMNFVNLEVINDWHPFYFMEIQMRLYEEMGAKIRHLREKSRKYIYDACFNAITARGFFPTDEIEFYPSVKKMREAMSFMDRAKKRCFCRLLCNFLNYCDRILLILLYTITRNSFKALADAFRLHDELGPSMDELNADLRVGVEVESRRGSDKPQAPFFLAELLLKPESVDIEPTEDTMKAIFFQHTNLILETVMEVKSFTDDPVYLIFTEPSIMGRQEERLADPAPDLTFLFRIDKEFQEDRKYIFSAIRNAYEKATLYAQRFETIRLNYQADVKTDASVIRNERSLEVLRALCERYHANMHALDAILPFANLGLLKLTQSSFKETVTPECLRLLNVLGMYLPKLASTEVDKIKIKAEELMAKIKSAPSSTLELVAHLRYLVSVEEDLNNLFKDVDYAHDCLILIKDFRIPIEDEEKEKYMDTEDLVVTCKETLIEKREERNELIQMLNDILKEDIKLIFEEIHDIAKEVQHRRYLDKRSDPDETKLKLGALLERLNECQEKAHEFRTYQKEFKIDVTRYDEMDRTFQEIKMRQNLWNCLEEWETSLDLWQKLSYQNLNMETMNNLNMKILKSCVQFEKYLPPNDIVPSLKASAEAFREKLPVLGYLKNANLKPRHYTDMELVLNMRIYHEENILISNFEAAHAFEEEIANQLMDISSQATGESQLEIMLRNIENIWKETELFIFPHRDSKDVFILVGTEELQTILDDSNVNINTIAASKYVAPIKAKVDEWISMFEQFGETLEEWINCQTSWIYLEAIFSSPDIQRQLPNEAKMFAIVDRSFKEIMRQALKVSLALPVMTNVDTYNTLVENNRMLDTITRGLEAYLEVKRVVFPRFYFLSNDELLEILAQTRVPQAVQPHLRKCFDAISKLEFGQKESGDGGKMIPTNDILAMLSPEGEKLLFGKGLKARGAVEEWLSKVEEAMFLTVKRYMKFGYQCYPVKERHLWFEDHPNQVVLTVSQQQWAAEIHEIFDSPDQTNATILQRLKLYERKCFTNLSALAAITRKEITNLLRKVLCALITVDVHARDSITNLLDKNVTKSNDFNWLKMLRFYWNVSSETMVSQMASAKIPYYYEYLGAGGVLVLTPLTDRCYLCLMGALQMDLGGAPAGPAGTGKTETTKDLAKAVAKQCVVFNCSEGLDFKMMGRFFSGLAQCGAWCCFDEFNRIDIEVLSVIAQQLITIRNAKVGNLKRFMFEGREIKLNKSCSVYITMNPGYAGRTELPDNLKALFRPIAMMVPDYALISEVILYSEGFEDPKVLAHKMVQMYKLCSEQLSQQNHYDFGMRAVKSVLVMAGSLKRSAPNQREDITLIAALRDSNIPKFLADDAFLFRGILSDLFPGVELPDSSHPDLQEGMVKGLEEKNLQPVPSVIRKCIQLYETMCVRWGVMLVGPTGGGKSTVLHTLEFALTYLFKNQIQGPNFREVIIQKLNPKSVSMNELYGYVNLKTMEWQDGLLGLAVRTAVNNEDEIHQWIVCDGPVDAVWIENMNTVLDDNKMLCLANSERIKLTPWVHMLFEVQDLAQASPATVSRCGMVFVDPDELGCLPLVQSWRNGPIKKFLTADQLEFTYNLFKTYFESIIKISIKYGSFAIHQVVTSKTRLCCELLNALIETIKMTSMDIDTAKSLLKKLFVWSTLWSVGSNFKEESQAVFQLELRKLLSQDIVTELPEDSVWDYQVNLKENTWEKWKTSVDPFTFNPSDKYFDMQVPTVDTTKFGYICEILFLRKYPVMITGDTGVGKTVLAVSTLKKLAKRNFVPVFLNFSAQTSSIRTQEMIEVQLEKRKKTLLSAPIGKTVIIFIDDVNMPRLDTYGSQPPIELLRQFLDSKGFYDREKLYWKDVIEVALGAGCAPPGGGRNPLTPRLVRHFALLHLPKPNNETLTTIFAGILSGFLSDFSAAIRPLAIPICNALVDVYTRIAEEMLPTPDKSHYIFNLRDLSKCVQGILQSDSSNYSTDIQMLRLFYHENMRVYYDRLINTDDNNAFITLMTEVCRKHFNRDVVASTEKILFGDFMVFGQNRSERIYEEIKDFQKLQSILMDYMDDYNSSTGKDMKLILFQDALEHTVRLARLLRADRGNGLLVGVAGMGKQSLTRLAAHVNEYKCFQIELRRNYDIVAFHDDLRILYRIAGVENTPLVFLIIDTQIVEEEFLEDINNILNSGEVPNLFEGDEYEKVILESRDHCNTANKAQGCSRDDIYKFFINRVRNNLHVVISMSPVGDAFRRRCRMFPSLVNCTTIDWFSSWPAEALYSVAVGVLGDVANKKKDRESLAKTSVFMHQTVEDASVRFYKEMKRHYYTTPSSYLELLKLYKSILKSRTDIITAKRKRISNGLNKILETNNIIAVMQKELEIMLPQQDAESAKMKELLAKLEVDTKNSDIVKEAVAKDEAIAKEKADICTIIAEDAQKDLEVAMPALKEAENALKSLSKADINEIKAFTTPPQLVQFVMEAVCILLGAKPSWASAKVIMTDVNFLKRLFEYDREHIPETTLRKIRTYIDHKDFVPAKIEKVSKVAKGVSLWVIAIDKFAKVYKVVEPKIKKQREAQAELDEVNKVLRGKQDELRRVEAKIQALKEALDTKSREFKVIQDKVDLTYTRINRAGRLTSALADEEIRWKETVETLSKELWAVPGDVLVASACVAYLGAFSTDYRKKMTEIWVAECQKYEIPSSTEFSLLNTLGDPYEMRSWAMAGLPRDTVSVENGLYALRALRWPLMIDPQEQANRWIRNLEKSNNLYVLKMTDGNFLRILENAIRQGYPVLIEDMDETIDPALRPVLQRETFIQEGRVYLKLGEVIIDYDVHFKLYMTTKLSNPHYLPEVCINVTLVNFLVTEAGLEDQLLADIVAIELPEQEIKRNNLIVEINTDKQQLLALEDKVLKLLFHSKGNILDDEELVETLNIAKETSLIIAARLILAEKTEKEITESREKYRTLASRGAILYFVIAGLAEIDPMYQYSLKYFSLVFCNVIQAEHPKMIIAERIAQLKEDELKAMFMNISRGLFENHKIIFSFLFALAIEKQEGRLQATEFSFLTRGAVGSFEIKPKPANITLSNEEWSLCCYLNQTFVEFKGLCEDIGNVFKLSINEFTEEFNFNSKLRQASNINWNSTISNFQKLMFIKAFRKEKFTACVTAYVRSTIGEYFVTVTGGSQLKNVYHDTSNVTPLVFVLSSGSDPMAAFLKFAEEMQYTNKFYSISLGQGQGPIAESLIEKSLKSGHWVFLQNCHLATSWMQQMETIVRNITLGITKAHVDFRLYFSSMPTKSFPISVLQNSVKLTNEPPKGIKANVLGALVDMNKDFFEQHILQHKWRALVFGICMFHSVILERRKFGPLGWNILYEFNESDRECGIKTLDVFIERKEMEAKDLPWEAIAYINGEITWGGRVTDYWDQRCLRTIYKKFSSPVIVDENYTYSRNAFYRNPRKNTLKEYVEYVHTFPIQEDPELFGMNQNANIVFQTKETDFFISTLLLGQPKSAGDDSQSADNDICLDMIKKIKDVLVTRISMDNMHPMLIVLDAKGQVPSLTTVLIQECDRYNGSLKIVHESLINLNKAIKGLVVMSESLEEVFWSFLNNMVPKMWAARSFLSIKSLPNYIADFQRRIDFIQDWVKNGSPRSYWISGLYFPQSFLTGILQTHARKYVLPIDVLQIDFVVTNTTLVQQNFFEKRQKGENDQILYRKLDSPDIGVIAHGIFIEAARWDQTEGGLCDARDGELYSRLPAVHFVPVVQLDPGKRYDAPLYKTQARSGVLSTTGHSTNFVLSILLESKLPPDFWILRGTALVSAVYENDS